MKLRTLLNEIVDKKMVGLVDVNILNNFRTQAKSKINYELWNDIEENGIKEPIVLTYHVHDNKVGISDGHHRLDAAIELGIDKIPTIVAVTGEDSRQTNKISPKIPNWKGKDWLSPKEIGL